MRSKLVIYHRKDKKLREREKKFCFNCFEETRK